MLQTELPLAFMSKEYQKQIQDFIESNFDDDGDKFIAALILVDNLKVEIIPEPEELVELAIDENRQGNLVCIVSKDFPDFYIDSGITLQQALKLCESLKLNFEINI